MQMLEMVQEEGVMVIVAFALVVVVLMRRVRQAMGLFLQQ
jgi:hypothetical protein